MTDGNEQAAIDTPRRSTNIVLWIFALIGCGLGSAALVRQEYYSDDRFYIIQDKDGVATEIDRRTGQTWRIYRNRRKYEVRPTEDAAVMPRNLISELSGKVVGEDWPGVWIDFYNGTDWTVSEITIRVPRTQNGRLYRKIQTISKHSTGQIIFDVGDQKVGQSGWTIAEARGFPPSKQP